jgi:hypothetical protein
MLPFAPVSTPLLGHCEALVHEEHSNTSVTPPVLAEPGVELVVPSVSVAFLTMSMLLVPCEVGQDAPQSNM